MSCPPASAAPPEPYPGHDPGPLSRRWCFRATGTRWQLLTASPLSSALRTHLTALVADFEDVWSRFRPDSLIRRAADGRLGAGDLTLDLPPGSAVLLDLYDRVHRATGGRVDPLVGADLIELGYDPDYSFTVRRGAASRLGAAHGRATWARDARHDGDRLHLARPTLIDVGAVGKGFLVDILFHELRAADVGAFVIDGSGDLRVSSPEPVRIGLEDPRRTGRVIGVVSLADAAVCASAVNRRSWGDGLHHLLDARSGLPVRGALASWAMAATCAEADALATALFLTSPQELARAGFRYDFVLMSTDGSVALSRGFADIPGEIFTARTDQTDEADGTRRARGDLASA